MINTSDNSLFLPIKNIKNIKENGYLVSKTGFIYSLYKESLGFKPKECFLKPYIDKDGYQRVGLMSQSGNPKYYTKGVHTIVICTFKGLPPSNMKDPTVNHIDGNVLNNNIENLEWMERFQNSEERLTIAKGENNGGNIYNESIIKNIIDYKIKNPKISCDKLHKIFDISRSQIYRILIKENWKYLTENIIFDIINYFTNPNYYNWGYKNETDELTVYDIGRSTKTIKESLKYTFFDNEYGIFDL